jgi:uncharacterized protein YecE (DUF72 family)
MASKSKVGKYYSGTSGLILPMPKYKFPEEHQASSRLTYYATLFQSIEINSSFYKIPLPRTVLKWASEVPDDFKFTFKIWKEITHTKNLKFNSEDVCKFLNSVNNVASKKGCLLFQFPPSLKAGSAAQLQKLLEIVKTADTKNSWTIALEFRDNSWYAKDILKLINDYKGSIVIHDKKGSPPMGIMIAAKTMYVRFHGPGGDYRGSYSDSFLSEYANYIGEWIEDGKDVYAYFNNTMGEAIKNHDFLRKYVNVIK